MKRGKEGQVTIFIIIGIIIVILVSLYFILIYLPSKNISPEESPGSFIEKCVNDVSKEAISIILSQGGKIEPMNYKEYLDNKISYLCYAEGNYKQCVMQEPFYIDSLEQEIKEYILPQIERCYGSLRLNLERKNYGVDLSPEMKLSDKLVENALNVQIERDLSITKSGETKQFDKLDINVPTKIYNLAIVGIEIANSESQYCNFEYNGYMLLHPNIRIERISTGEDIKIYYIKDKATQQELKVAIKSCTLPPGF